MMQCVKGCVAITAYHLDLAGEVFDMTTRRVCGQSSLGYAVTEATHILIPCSCEEKYLTTGNCGTRSV